LYSDFNRMLYNVQSVFSETDVPQDFWRVDEPHYRVFSEAAVSVMRKESEYRNANVYIVHNPSTMFSSADLLEYVMDKQGWVSERNEAGNAEADCLIVDGCGAKPKKIPPIRMWMWHADTTDPDEALDVLIKELDFSGVKHNLN